MIVYNTSQYYWKEIMIVGKIKHWLLLSDACSAPLSRFLVKCVLCKIMKNGFDEVEPVGEGTERPLFIHSMGALDLSLAARLSGSFCCLIAHNPLQARFFSDAPLGVLLG